jgi:hypothetical protein
MRSLIRRYGVIGRSDVLVVAVTMPASASCDGSSAPPAWHPRVMPSSFPALRAVVVDATNAREVAEFYRQLLGYQYRLGDERPPAGQPDPRGEDWLVLRDGTGDARLAVQHVPDLPESTWPDTRIPQQLHLDLTVGNLEDLGEQRDRALSFGAKLLLDRTSDLNEPLFVFSDPAGHPFCIFVSPDHPT